MAKEAIKGEYMVEYYASPFNVTGVFPQWGSMFKLDEIFGAIGNAKIIEWIFDGVLNPPYLPEEIEICAERAYEQSRKYRTMLFMTIPKFDSGTRKNETLRKRIKLWYRHK